MKTSDFDYHLPAERIAQTPIEPRDASRLLVVHRDSGQLEHRTFADIGEYLHAGDILVANDSRVLPVRLHGRKESGGQVELLLLNQVNEVRWEALVRGHRLRPGVVIELAAVAAPLLRAKIVDVLPAGSRLIEFDRPPLPELERLGDVPLPPYIHTPLADRERYQTVYARVHGSAAAPTAGLHFTPALIERLQAQGVRFAFVTLHIGLDTFRPLQVEQIADHQMHSEWAELTAPAADAINASRRAGGRCVAVGTTAVRVLEAASRQSNAIGDLRPFSGWTSLFLTPGADFYAVDALITNFHLPRSTLLMLVSAFAGKPLIDRAYAAAVREGYRFFSFGDAMLLV
ncbi:tRNA preQ1(34) S-adenosylmethionine ribosyltransferase-isomerase QueA [Candidatus Amarolinea aalborgensis]|uniref:tRNA preQ1(34) S-adenosylmethionine ribosyltransferase-isomerase QueA n=1 Tax=Candidatus Amarolinea aalborgensis TaxID=2249329 RepID=UPI003BF98981